MLTYKYRLQSRLEIDEYINAYNNVLRFAYNRFQDIPDLKLSECEHLVKEKMNNIDMLDSSLIKIAVNKAKGIEGKKAVFGGKYNMKRRSQQKITHEQWKETRNLPILLRGSSSDNNGNRKAKLTVTEDNSIVLKFNKTDHIKIQLPRMNKEQKRNLCLLQTLCEEHKTCFSLEVSPTTVSIIFDENILKVERPTFIRDRILSFDMNPNFVGISIIDWKSETDKTIIHKEIVSIKDINDLDHNVYMTNKRKHETMHISKHIMQLALHFQCQTVAFEALSMKSSDKKKGTRYNKLVNNYWIRNAFVNNIKKRCNIADVAFQEIDPQYSSFIGQLNNPDDYDSVAASIELSRRCFLYRKIYLEKTMKPQNIIFPEFNVDSLNFRWKDRLGDIPCNINSWTSLYKWNKKSKSSYRVLFSPKGEKFFKLYSWKSLTKRTIISCLK